MALFSFPAQVNEYAARVVAFAVASLCGLALLMQWPYVLPVVAVGFLLRVGWGPRFSPLARGAMAVAARLWEPIPVPGLPKRFAQAIGAVCSLTACALFAGGHPTLAWAVVGLLTTFATLEAALGFCAGCWLYARGERWGFLPPATGADGSMGTP